MQWRAIISSFVGQAASLGGLLGSLTFLDERRRERGKTAGEIAKGHRELYAYIRSIPGSAGFFDRSRDLAASPRTNVETQCVCEALVHLSWALAEHAAGRYDLPEGLEEDIRNFFSYPVRWDAWQELKRFQDGRVVRRVERALAAR